MIFLPILMKFFSGTPIVEVEMSRKSLEINLTKLENNFSVVFLSKMQFENRLCVKKLIEYSTVKREAHHARKRTQLD